MKKLNLNARFWLRAVVCVIASFVLVFAGYIFIATLVDNQMPMLFGRGTAVVRSGSMEPELSVFDLVFVKASKSYEEGDIVVYKSGDILIIHRIISISPDGETVITQGDANPSADAPINISAIKGKKTGKISGGGKVIDFLRSPVVMGVLLVVAVALLVLPSCFKKKKEDEKEDENNGD